MKKILSVIFILGVLNTIYAQDPEYKVQVIELEGVVLKPPNFEYLASVQSKHTPATVKVLERKAAYFDIEESPVYNDSFDTYEVFFSHSDGRVIATYDKDGQIVKSYEKFKDIPIPAPIRNTVQMTYPDWTINKHTYVVSYYRDKSIKKTYHFQIRKGKDKKNLKMVMNAGKN